MTPTHGAALRLAATGTFITRLGFPPNHSRNCWTPWSVFQDGTIRDIINASIVCTQAAKPHQKQLRPKTENSQTDATTHGKTRPNPKAVQYTSLKQAAETPRFKTQVPLPPRRPTARKSH